MWPGQQQKKNYGKVTVTQKVSSADSTLSGLSGWTKIKPLGATGSITDQYRYKPRNSEMDRAPSVISGTSSKPSQRAFSMMSGGSTHSTGSVAKMLANAKTDIKASAYEGCITDGPLGPAKTKEERRNRKLLIGGICTSAIIIILCLALKEIGYNNSLKEIMDEKETVELIDQNGHVQQIYPNNNQVYPSMINPYFLNPFQNPFYNQAQPLPNQPQHTVTVTNSQPEAPSAQALIAPMETEEDHLLELLDSDLTDSTLYSRVIKKFQALQSFITSLMSLNLANPTYNEKLHNMNSRLENLVEKEQQLLLEESALEQQQEILEKPDESVLQEFLESDEEPVIKQKLMRPANTLWTEELEKKMQDRRQIALQKREERLRLQEERKNTNRGIHHGKHAKWGQTNEN